MGTVLLTSTVVVANVTGATMVLPQVLRLRRGQRVDGVSPLWVGAGMATNVWWAAYALHQQVWGLAPVTAVGAVLYSVIAAQYAAIAGPTVVPRFVAGALGSSVAPAAALVVAGMPAAGVVLGFSYAVQFAPAAWTARRAERVDGVAPITWVLAWVEAAAWFGYGAAIGDAALVIGGAGGALMSSLVLISVLGRSAAPRPRRRASAARVAHQGPGVVGSLEGGGVG